MDDNRPFEPKSIGGPGVPQALRHAARLAGAREAHLTHAVQAGSCQRRGPVTPLIIRIARLHIPPGSLEAGQQIAFARVITDRATFANLVDFIVLSEYRIHALYAQFGLAAPVFPGTLMARCVPGVYEREVEQRPGQRPARSVHPRRPFGVLRSRLLATRYRTFRQPYSSLVLVPQPIARGLVQHVSAAVLTFPARTARCT